MSIKDFSLVYRQAPMESVGWPQNQLLKRKSINLMISIDRGLLLETKTSIKEAFNFSHGHD